MQAIRKAIRKRFMSGGAAEADSPESKNVMEDDPDNAADTPAAALGIDVGNADDADPDDADPGDVACADVEEDEDEDDEEDVIGGCDGTITTGIYFIFTHLKVVNKTLIFVQTTRGVE